MSETKHSPGPWFIAKEPTDSGLAMIEDGKQDGLFPIRCEWSEAHLIAAAPEMYEVLQTITDWMGTRPYGEFEDIGLDMLWFEQSRDALAKARGDSND